MRTAQCLVAVALLLLSQVAAVWFVLCLEESGSQAVVETLSSACCGSRGAAPVSLALQAESAADPGPEAPCGDCLDVPLRAPALRLVSQGSPAAGVMSPVQPAGRPAGEERPASAASQRYSVADLLAIRALPPAFGQMPAAVVLLA